MKKVTDLLLIEPIVKLNEVLHFSSQDVSVTHVVIGTMTIIIMN